MHRGTLSVLGIGVVLVGVGRLCVAESTLDDTATKDVVKLVHTLSDAFVKGDADTIKGLLAEDQIAIFDYGEPETKADQLKKLADLKFEEASLDHIKPIPISKDVVAVAYKLVRKGTFKRKALTPEVYALAVWAKRDGKWQQVTYQETLPQKQ
jgi:hypothetical protein